MKKVIAFHYACKSIFPAILSFVILLSSCSKEDDLLTPVPNTPTNITNTDTTVITIGLVQKTYVPDDNFEQALINLGYDNVLDDYVITTNINTVTTLSLSNQGISNLTGVEDFIALDTLHCDQNLLSTLDVSQNSSLNWLTCTYNQLNTLQLSSNIIRLDCYFNNLTSLDVSQCVSLSDLRCGYNKITTLDLTYNNNLVVLGCNFNRLTKLDVSSCSWLSVLFCGDNELTELNVRNGNNLNFWWSCGLPFYCQNNPFLTCITVDNPQWSKLNWLVDNDQIDLQHYFSTDCAVTTEVEEQPFKKQTVRVLDILGKETAPSRNTPLFCIYDGGVVEKKIIIK
jgi:hypothetical protein